MNIEQDREALEAELDSIMSPPSEPWSTRSDVTIPSQSPTYEAVVKSGQVDDVTWSSKINQMTKDMEAGSVPQSGALGSTGIALPGLEKEQVLATREQRLSAQQGTLPSSLDRVSAFAKLFVRDWVNEFNGAPEGDIMAAAGAQATAQGESSLSKISSIQALQDREIAAQKERAGIAAARANPDAGVTRTIESSGILSGVVGQGRAAVDSSVQALASIPTGIVESIGIGASIAERSVGLEDKIGDNSIQAVARYAQAWAVKMFPGDKAAQEDFAVKLGSGIGSTAGFWGVNAAAIASKIGTSQRAAVLASIGALSQGAQGYKSALQSRDVYGRDVSDLQLSLAFAGAMALGTTEALPISKSFPTPILNNRKMAYALKGLLEGGEEGIQEFGQSIGDDIFSKALHDPTRRIGDDAFQNALVGFTSGGTITTARLAISRRAREEAWQEMQGAQPAATSAAPTATPAAPAPAAAPQTATPGKPFTVDLSEVYGNQIAASARPYNPAAEISGSARQNAIGSAVPLPMPTFEQVRAYLPTDENGQPSMEAFHEIAEKETGKRYWNQLDDTDKLKVFQALELGVTESAQAPQIAAGAVAATDEAKPAAAVQAAPAPAAQQQTAAEGSGQINPPQGGAALASNLPATAAAVVTPAANAAPVKADPKVQAAQSQAMEAVEIYRRAGVTDDVIERASAVPPSFAIPEQFSSALDGIDVNLDIQVPQEDGSIDTETLMLPAIQALDVIDRRLKGVTLLLKCLG